LTETSFIGIRKEITKKGFDMATYAVFTREDNKPWRHEMDFRGSAEEAREEREAWENGARKCKLVRVPSHLVNSLERDVLAPKA
jgi:hypothetical protein